MTFEHDDLMVDPARTDFDESTGIYVRARCDRRIDSWDIACLEKLSLLQWMQENFPTREKLELFVLRMLRHDTD
jgi:hypothetical protein